MLPDCDSGIQRRKVRGELLRQYVQLQREIMESDPGSSAYQATIRAFRQMGHLLISSGFEEDLDRLLRIRIIDGDQPARTRRSTFSESPQLHLLERRLPS